MTTFLAGPSGWSGSEVVGSATGFWMAVALLGLALIAGASVRFVAGDERLVIARFGRVARVAGPGVVLRIPGFERVSTVSIRPVHMPLVTTASTQDGVTVRIMTTAVCRITDPMLSIAAPDPLCVTALAVEGTLQKEVSRRSLVELYRASERLERRLPREISADVAKWGTQVQEIEVTDIEAGLSPGLLRALHR